MKHKQYLKTGLLSLAVLCGLSAYAQNEKVLTLDQAVEMSLKNSGQLKLDNAKVDEAAGDAKEAWNNHLPDAKVTGAYMRLNSPTVDLKVKLGSGSGGSAPAIKVNQAAYGILNASLPVFSGLRIKYGVESAKYLEQAAKLDVETDREEVIMNTANAFSALFKAREYVGLVKENLKQQQQRVTDFSNLEKNGLVARNDLLKVQLQESNVELTLLEAENDLQITYTNVNLLLGLPQGTEVNPDTSGFHIADPGSLIQWEESAYKNRKDLASLSYREKAANTAIKATKGEYYPGIAVTGGVIAADIPNLLTINDALNVGLGLSYNFGAIWKTGAKVKQANARLHQLQANESMLSDRVRLDVTQSYQNYILSLKKIDVYRKAMDQAVENYRITKNKYDNNLVTTTDLLEADVAQLQAQLASLLSKADALVAYKKLQQTAGMLIK
jgi:outer membrane protein TolC